jgi:hypothetical protein
LILIPLPVPTTPLLITSWQVIWEEMQGAIHAVDQMTCKTPEEAGL